MRFIMKQEQESDTIKQLWWPGCNQNNAPIIKVPLQFMFPPVQTLSKELTKLNSNHSYRIVYLGPRWDNSVTFHKQYTKSAGYEFDEKKVNSNNNFCQDSMNHNQFYKRQIYYRAFQGMNPTIKTSQDLIFQSRFESGNLDCVVRVGPDEYDLFLRIDSNTRGNISWFYFSAKSACKRRAKLNICNLTKNYTHYAKGLNPFVCRSNSNNWSQDGFESVKFCQKKLRYDFLYEKVNMATFFELSFEFEFKEDEDVKFAYCIPYTYSDLLCQLKCLPKIAGIGCIGQSLTGVSIPFVCIGKDEEHSKKPVLVITGRVHPSESNSSLIISRLMKQLCFNEQMRYLRDRLMIIIIPMLNPDGVILGNSRVGASGKDLNRQFRTKNKSLFPEITALKMFLTNLSEYYSIEMYLDFHGHSRKKNMFVFGPDYSVTEPMYYKCRILPKLLSTITSTFRYYGCSYSISQDKKSTARAAMLRELLIPYVYTVQTSLGFYYDTATQQTLSFDQESWQNLGVSMLKAISQYYLSMDQLQEYMQARKKAKRNASRNSSSNQSYVDSLKTKNNDGKNYQGKNIKVLQIYREIKLLQEKKPKKNKQEGSSNSDSDSYDQKEDLEKEKMNQFNFMVTECIKDEHHRRNRARSTEESLSQKQKPEKQRRLAILKRRQERQKAQEDLLGQFELQLQSRLERQTIKSQMHTRSQAVNYVAKLKVQRGVAIAHQCQKQSSSKDKIISILQQHRAAHDQSEQNFASCDKRSNKINVRMFNFHKAISDIDHSRNGAFRKKDSKSIKNHNNQFSLHHHKSSITPLHSIKFPSKKQGEKVNLSLHQSKNENESQIIQQLEYCKSGEMRHREKYKFPPSYYKIRYQSKRKELQQKKQKSFQEHFDIRNAFQSKPEQRRVLSFASFEDKLQKKKEGMSPVQSSSQQSYGLFARISQFPLL